MRARHVPEVREFAARALPWLERDPVENNVLCTIVGSAVAGSRPFDDPLWLLVEDGAEVVGVAIQDPPRNLLLARAPEAVTDALVELVLELRPDLPGVGGPAETAAAYAEAWARRSGRLDTLGMGQRLYRVEQVRTPHEVPGGLRRATEADRSLLASWLEGFATESATTVDSGMLDRALGRNGLFVWQHGGQPVSMAWHSPVVGGVARVSGVYTPPEERGHGYASAVAAGTSHAAMAAGATVCMLYTDLANPTSNAIYQRIGYRPVCDAQDHQFQPPPEPHAGPERADQGAELEPVPERPTVEHLAEALERLAEMDDAVPDGARLSGWFVVAEHEVDGGKHTVLTRYAPDEQPPWRSMGLLRFAGSAEEHQAFAPEPAYPDDADYPDG